MNFRTEKNENLIDDYLKLIGLEEFREYYSKDISEGMKKRVAIARALINNPKVILMDEPFGSLDAQTRVLMQKFLLDIWEAHRKKIIFVTHDIDEAIFLSDRVIVLSKKPSKIVKEFKINFKRPRTNDLFKKEEYFRLKEEIRLLLKENV
jgi:ABC-type nitrate/sulfonate/bicarbonate transport system ATPase subunit